jgi:hypothetical protein
MRVCRQPWCSVMSLLHMHARRVAVRCTSGAHGNYVQQTRPAGHWRSLQSSQSQPYVDRQQLRRGGESSASATTRRTQLRLVPYSAVVSETQTEATSEGQTESVSAGARRHTPFQQLGVDARLVVRRSSSLGITEAVHHVAILKLAGQSKGEMEPLWFRCQFSRLAVLIAGTASV